MKKMTGKRTALKTTQDSFKTLSTTSISGAARVKKKKRSDYTIIIRKLTAASPFTNRGVFVGLACEHVIFWVS